MRGKLKEKKKKKRKKRLIISPAAVALVEGFHLVAHPSADLAALAAEGGMIQHSLGQHPGAFQARVAAGSHKAEGVADQGYFDQNTCVVRQI